MNEYLFLCRGNNMFLKKLPVTLTAGILFYVSLSLLAQEIANKPQNIVSKPSVTTPIAQTSLKLNTLLDGTPVKLRLGRTLSSADAKVGEEVDFDVLEEVKVNDVVVIGKGGLALATITTAEHKKNMGRGGKLDVNIDSVRLIDNEKVALRATDGGKGGGHVGAMTGAMVATSIVFFPAAPLFLFMHGKDMTIPKGTEITAYINGDMTLDMSRFTPSGLAPTVADVTASQIMIDANVSSCDIEVDGAFVGNTPSQLSLTPGKHHISVKKKGYQTWTRDMMVSGSGVHISADMVSEIQSIKTN
jgi:hypothetical protein